MFLWSFEIIEYKMHFYIYTDKVKKFGRKRNPFKSSLYFYRRVYLTLIFLFVLVIVNTSNLPPYLFWECLALATLFLGQPLMIYYQRLFLIKNKGVYKGEVKLCKNRWWAFRTRRISNYEYLFNLQCFCPFKRIKNKDPRCQAFVLCS